jgi:putative transposase
MKRKQWSVEEKISILEKVAASSDVVTTCRNLGVSTGTYYNWKNSYEARGKEGLKPLYNKNLQAPAVKGLEEENKRLRKLLIEKELELEAGKELLKKKFGTDDIRKI